ncbi:tRNA dihydrouridine synthase DusB [Harryflintia acetispora]|uniref:tRNA dihydrouridine synthase DusB n=1 Tax=Harryflintia acetispora TaxID=1849041 RepID=UPI00189AEF17|nr:tRNA dihydrouridine synthase DusB [Harryflintia acetispora]
MRIGNVTIEGHTALAPMAGVADRSFRTICKELGASYLVGEMASAKGMHYSDKKTALLLEVTEPEHPMAVQIFGTEPALMADCARSALRFSPDIIDINMGCPAPKIVGGGAGSALMKTPVLAGKIIEAVARAVDIPVTVKLRLGWDDEHQNAVELARIAQESGAAAVTVHGRTRQQMYAGRADLAAIRQVVKSLSIPVIGNGDVCDPISAKRMLDETGCALVMVGRGALGAPWVFGQIERYLCDGVLLPAPPMERRMEILLRQIKMAVAHKGEYIALREARSHAAWYFKGLRGAAALRREAGQLEVYSDLERLCERALAQSEEN